MSTLATTRAIEPPDEREWSPAEGWTSVALLLLMLLALGLAVDQARWVGTTVAGESRTGFLPIVLLAGAVWGFIGAKSSLPALAVHAIGAVIGGLLVITLVADINSTAQDLQAQLVALSASLDRFGVDLLVRQVRSTETAPFLLVTGCIACSLLVYITMKDTRTHSRITTD